MTIAESLKRFRKAFGLSQKDVANVLGIKQPSYAVYESSTIPSTRMVIKLADHYNISLDYLLGRTDNPRPYDKSATQGTPSEKPVVQESVPAKLQVVPSNVPREKPVESLQSRLARIESALTANGIQL